MNHHPKKVLYALLSFAAALVLAIALLIVNGPVTPTHAQDGQRINYGENLLGQVAGPEGSLFNFEGQAGDVANIEIIGFSGFVPSVALLDSTRTVVLAVADNLAGDDTVSLEYTLTTGSLHYIQVRGTTTPTGQFAITLEKGERPLPPAIPLTAGAPVQGTVTSGELPVVYDFSTSPTEVSELRVSSLSPGYSPIITVLSQDGQTIASLNNPRLLGTTLVFAPGQETLKLVIDLGGFTSPATIEVQLIYGPSSGVSPAGTEEPSEVVLPQLPTTGQCVLATLENQNVNVRRGPSVDYEILVTISPQSIYNVLGRNADSSWFLISYGGGSGSGWVAAQVTRLGGACGAVPTATFPPPPNVTLTATPTPSVTPTLNLTITATPTTTGTLNATATPSVTPTATSTP